MKHLFHNEAQLVRGVKLSESYSISHNKCWCVNLGQGPILPAFWALPFVTHLLYCIRTTLYWVRNTPVLSNSRKYYNVRYGGKKYKMYYK